MSTFRFTMKATKSTDAKYALSDEKWHVPLDTGKDISVLAASPEEATEKATSLLGPLVGGAYWMFETLAIIEQNPEPVMTIEDAERPINYNVHFEFGDDSRQTMRGMARTLADGLRGLGSRR